MPDVLASIIENARLGPDRPAARDLDSDLSYGQLVEEAARVGAGLTSQGVVAGDRVALLLPNSVEFVVAALACLWIGAVFVPLAIDDPESRLISILDNCAPAMVITQSEGASSPRPGLEARFKVVLLSSLRHSGDDLPDPIGVASRVAYAIYTSGTTGEPKGVLIGTEAFGAAIEAISDSLGLDGGTRTLCVSPFHFDGSFGTMFSTFLRGGTAVIRPRDALLFPRTFFSTVTSEGITHSGFSPSYLRLLLTSPQIETLRDSPLRIVALGGEAPALSDLRALWSVSPKLRIFNRYGPTETTIAVTDLELTPETIERGTIPLGKPHEGTRFYLVDDNGAIVEGSNQVGELYIAGAQLMSGYWGAPDLTSEVMRADVVPGELVYRTGDLVYRDAEGNYVYVERADRVVKRSGLRISLLELSEAMNRLSGVRAAACSVFDDHGQLGIVAFVMADESITLPGIRLAAREVIPQSMLPNEFLLVDALPLTTSSKLDERRLLADAGLQPLPRRIDGLSDADGQ